MKGRTPNSKRRSWTGLPSSIQLIDALSLWAKAVVIALGVIGFFYCVAHFGLGSTLLHAIFSP